MTYNEIATEKFNNLKQKKDVIILAIESSCDETAVAVVKNGREVLASEIYSQIKIHKKYGGVVPEIASRNHTEKINEVAEKALEKSGLRFLNIDAIAVTYGAGLNGALLVGLTYAKALALSLNLPLIGVNHIRGHISANYIADKTLEPPFCCLVISGGHTSILEILDYKNHRLIGSTVDDAAGEAFDKVSRVLGLGYPGGPEVEKHAKLGKNTIKFPKPAIDGFNFSYSGLKTSVINHINRLKMLGEEINVNDICASFQSAAIDSVADKAVEACKKYNLKNLCIAGGVSANGYLRDYAKKVCEKNGIKLIVPDFSLCTDNAAMIGAEAYYKILTSDNPDSLSLNAEPSLEL